VTENDLRLTLELARLLLWLYSVPAPERELTLAEFLSRRFGNWYDKLMELPDPMNTKTT
jgi:hypothetical protein